MCKTGWISSHHHLLEFVEVHGTAAVLVHLLNDVVKVVLRQGVVNLAQNILQHVVCDETLTLEKKDLCFLSPFLTLHLFVVNPESLLEFLLHLLLIVLNHEFGRNLKIQKIRIYKRFSF